MKNIKQSKLFIKIVIGALIGLTLLYSISIHFLVNQDILVSHSYKHFLLKHTKSPRLIIESGSNSFHALNTKMLEKELGILTLNLADNASYPLKHKLLRLESYTRSGDIVLLALEWEHYSYQKIPHIFIHNVFDKLNFYYKTLPWLDKLKLIFKIPISSVIQHLYQPQLTFKENYSAQYQREYQQLMTYEKKFYNLERGGSKPEDTPPVDHKIERNLCNKYILTNQLKYGFTLSIIFKKNIEIINRIQKKGVKVFFIWPTVAGDNCYKGEVEHQIIDFSNRIKNYITQHNIPFISEFNDSNFTGDYILNTYYHVIPKAKDIQTKQLIKNIKNSTVINWFKTKKTKPYHLKITSSEAYENIFKGLDEVHEKEILRLGTNTLKNNLFLANGWFFHDNEKAWSQGHHSTLVMKLSHALKGKALNLIIESAYYNPRDISKTEIRVNGQSIGSYKLDGKNKIFIPKHLTQKKSGLLKIAFYYNDVKSPYEWGDGLDRRKFKLWIRSLVFLVVK